MNYDCMSQSPKSGQFNSDCYPCNDAVLFEGSLNPLSRVNSILIKIIAQCSQVFDDSLNPLSRVNSILIYTLVAIILKKRFGLNPLSRVNSILMILAK